MIEKDPAWGEWSKKQLVEGADRAALAINPIVYAEVSVSFPTLEALNAYLPEGEFQRLALPYNAGFLAGIAFRAYRRRGGMRRSPLPDFYIGAHAAVEGLELLTRDPARYATYFPKVRLIAP